MIATTHEEQVMILTEKVARLECNVYELQRTMNSIINNLSHEFLKNALADRKTENNSEKPNNSTRSKMEQVDKDTNVRSKYDCKTCKHDLWHTPRMCGKCVRQEDGKPSMYEPKDEPRVLEIIEAHMKMCQEKIGEPQTDEEYINNLPWTEVGNGEQTDCAWKESCGK